MQGKAKTFKEFEHAGWQSVGGPYHDYFGSLTRQTIEPLLDAVNAGPSTRLLDVATGPGYVADAAAKRGASVVGIDFSSTMVEIARGLYPELEFLEGDAEQLNFPDRSFDAVVMNFGILHLDRPEQALREAYRVVRSSGSFAYSVWAQPDQSLGFDIVLRAIQERGDPSVPLPPGPPFFRFSDMSESEKEMKSAGFERVHILKVPMIWKLNSADALFDAFYKGTPRTGGTLRAQSPEQLAAIREQLQINTQPYAKDQMLQIPMVALVVSGTRA